MSNEVNIVETFYGTMDPGVVLEFYDPSGKYEDVRHKACFFSVEPDPVLPGNGFSYEWVPNKLDLEVTRTWTTVWVDANDNRVFQRNATVANIGQSTAAYHLLRAETDN